MLAPGGRQADPRRIKSVRCRAVLRRILERDDRLPGTALLHPAGGAVARRQGFEDLVVAYPTADRARDLASWPSWPPPSPSAAPVLMVDDAAHLDLIEAAIGGGAGADPRLHRPRRRLVAARRRGSRSAPSARRSGRRGSGRSFGREIAARPGAAARRADGLRGPDRRRRRRGSRARAPQPRRSAGCSGASEREIAERRAAIVAAVREVAALEFVNGGGTGSLARTAPRPARHRAHRRLRLLRPGPVRRLQPLLAAPGGLLRAADRPQALAAGSRPRSAAATSPRARPTPDRLPQPYLPPGLQLDRQEGAGEVQTPLLGAAAARLRVGDRVYMRHAKAASCASASTPSTWSRATGSSTRCRPTAARARPSSRTDRAEHAVGVGVREAARRGRAGRGPPGSRPSAGSAAPASRRSGSGACPSAGAPRSRP